MPTDTTRAASRLRERIEAIEHPCHEACVGDLHADCQCAAWVRQEAIATVEAALRADQPLGQPVGEALEPDEHEAALRARMAEPFWLVFTPDADFEVHRLLGTVDALRAALRADQHRTEEAHAQDWPNGCPTCRRAFGTGEDEVRPLIEQQIGLYVLRAEKDGLDPESAMAVVEERHPFLARAVAELRRVGEAALRADQPREDAALSPDRLLAAVRYFATEFLTPDASGRWGLPIYVGPHDCDELDKSCPHVTAAENAMFDIEQVLTTAAKGPSHAD